MSHAHLAALPLLDDAAVHSAQLFIQSSHLLILSRDMKFQAAHHLCNSPESALQFVWYGRELWHSEEQAASMGLPSACQHVVTIWYVCGWATSCVSSRADLASVATCADSLTALSSVLSFSRIVLSCCRAASCCSCKRALSSSIVLAWSAVSFWRRCLQSL